jgi:hypothetical protein
MSRQRVQVQRKPQSTRSTTTRDRDRTPATDRREIRKDIAKVWWPES